MSDQTPPTPEPKPQAAQPAPQVPPAGQSGGVNISGGPVNYTGDILVSSNKTTTTTSAGEGLAGQGNEAHPKPSTQPAGAGEAFVKSSWANGLFYLFAFLAIVGVLGFFANRLDLITLALIVIAGIIAVPVLGALQLRMDKRLSEKSFLSLMKMSISQLPVIGGLVKK